MKQFFLAFVVLTFLSDCMVPRFVTEPLAPDHITSYEADDQDKFEQFLMNGDLHET